MPQTIHAIPTSYNGVRFRSRLEAKWAAFMDILGWEWDYEPIDLCGYIPDFILKRRSLLVEVKPFTKGKQLDDACTKIVNSGWTRDFIVVGTCLFHSDSPGSTQIALGWQQYPTGWQFSRATFIYCGPCEYGIVGRSDRCRVCGECHNRPIDEFDFEILKSYWKDACNTVQWKGR